MSKSISICVIETFSDGSWPQIIHSPHIGFEEWFIKWICPENYRFVGTKMLEGVKEKCPIWSFPSEKLQETINTAKSAFKKVEVVEAGKKTEEINDTKDLFVDIKDEQVGQLSLF